MSQPESAQGNTSASCASNSSITLHLASVRFYKWQRIKRIRQNKPHSVRLRRCYTFTWNPPQTQLSVSISSNNNLPNVCFSHLSNKHADSDGRCKSCISTLKPLSTLLLLQLKRFCLLLLLLLHVVVPTRGLAKLSSGAKQLCGKGRYVARQKNPTSTWTEECVRLLCIHIPPWSVAVWGSSWAPWPPCSLGNMRWFPAPGEQTQRERMLVIISHCLLGHNQVMNY